MKRLFVAIEMPAPVKAIAIETKALLEQELIEAGWVPPGNVHLTLKFLGDSPDERIGQIILRLRLALADRTACLSATTSFGAFPSEKRARILWLGIEDTPELKKIYNNIESALNELGFDFDKRPFRPHLTLARLKRPISVDIGLIDSKINAKQPVSVGAVALFSSRLSSAGAVYELLAKIDLMPARA